MQPEEQKTSPSEKNLPPELNFQPASTLPPAVKTSRKTKKIWIIVSAIVVVILIVIIAVVYTNRSTEPVETEQSKALAKALQNYPGAYIEADLPQYPEAQISNTVRSDATVTDGAIQVYASTNDSTEAVLAYFDTELTGSGWVLATETIDESNNQVRVYTKEDQQFGLTVGPNGSPEEGFNGATVVLIDWRISG